MRDNKIKVKHRGYNQGIQNKIIDNECSTLREKNGINLTGYSKKMFQVHFYQFKILVDNLDIVYIN